MCNPASRGPQCPCIQAPAASPAASRQGRTAARSVPLACPLLFNLPPTSKCCQAMCQHHLAASSCAARPPTPPGCSRGGPLSHLTLPLLWEEAQRSKAAWGPTVWASAASRPLSRALTRRAQFLSVIPESPGLDIPCGLSFGQRPNTQRTELPWAYPAGCGAIHFTPFSPAVGQASLSLDPACESAHPPRSPWAHGN